MSDPACRLYLITPNVIDDAAAFAAQLTGALEGGDVAALQVRLKDAPDEVIRAVVGAVRPICRANSVTLFLNDRPDLAAELGCDGVHLGQTDMSVAEARRIVGNQSIIGVTCHDSRHLAMDAAEAGADYVAFGAFFPTQTKDTLYHPDLEVLSIWQETMLIPCVAIGGITAENAAPLATAGADFLAVCAGVWGHSDGPAAAVRALNVAIETGLRARVPALP